MNTVGTPLLWGGFAVVVAIMLAIDLLLQVLAGTCHDHAGCGLVAGLGGTLS